MVDTMNRCVLLLSVVGIAACGGCSIENPAPAGDVQLGTYAITSKGIFKQCSLKGFPEELTFSATMAFFDGGGLTFFDGFGTFDGGFDGQVATFQELRRTGAQLFDGGTCSACTLTYSQRGSLALLSPSQNGALNDTCPKNFLDGGVFADADAGIGIPAFLSDGGFDAVRACGELAITVTGEGFCDPACYACDVRYRMSGPRSR